VTFIDPFLDDRTRTVKVRVNLKNPDRKLKVGMYASATIRVRLLGNGIAAPTGLEGKFSCSMHPEVIQDTPGKCPICKMDLILVPEGNAFAGFSGDPHAEHGNAVEATPPSEHAEHASDTPMTDTPMSEKTMSKKTMSKMTMTEMTMTDAAMKETAPDVTTAEPEGNPLAIPVSAVLDTGRRQITYRATKDGNYELVELTVGSLATATDEAGGTTLYYPVLKGLSEGDSVVIRGGFLLDSQTQIEGRPSLLFPKGQTGSSGSGMSMPMPAGGEHKH